MEIPSLAPPKATPRRRWRSLAVGLVLSAICVTLVAAVKKKLSVEDIMDLLSAGVSVRRVAVLVQERGVAFQLTPQLQQNFMDAGADPPLIHALEGQSGSKGTPPEVDKEIARIEQQRIPPDTLKAPVDPIPTPSPGPVATLQIRSRPGGATVWVDNEMKGVTDPDEGRLEISGLRPGKRRLRALLEGYEPVEGTVELAPGQSLEMPLWLSKSAAPPPAVPAPELPSGRKFLVRHKHRAIEGIAPEGTCLGWMVVNVGYLRYISTDSPHKYLMNTSEMREAKATSGHGQFRIKLDFGRTFDFLAVNEKGDAVNAAPVLTEIRYSMGE